MTQEKINQLNNMMQNGDVFQVREGGGFLRQIQSI